MTGKQVTRDEWLGALRAYIGTPFRHQGRTKGVGIDCIGLLACASRDLGIDSARALEVADYHPTPDDKLFATKAPEYLEPLPYNRIQAIDKQIKPGDVMFFWIDKRGYPRHVAVYAGKDHRGGNMMIHAYAKYPRKVVEMPMPAGYWGPRLVSIWRLPAIKD